MQDYASKPDPSTVAPSSEQLFRSYPVQNVEPSSIKKWLEQGWTDMKASPATSLGYGVLFALAGIIMSYISSANPAFIVAATTGFFLVGPFLAVGLYTMSQQLERNQKPSFAASFESIKDNAVSLGLYAVVLGMLMIFWVRISALVIGIFFDQMGTSADGFGYADLWQSLWGMEDSVVFILSFLGVGLLFALIAFITGVVTVPMLLDRKVDIVTAATTSIRAVAKNPKTMLLWAITITVIVGLGLITFNLGLIVAMPLIAHASWHAYRDLVRSDDQLQ